MKHLVEVLNPLQQHEILCNFGLHLGWGLVHHLWALPQDSFLEDSYYDIAQGLLICAWFPRVPWPFQSSHLFQGFITLRPRPFRSTIQDFLLLGYVPVAVFPSSSLACLAQGFCLHPGTPIFVWWSLPTPEAIWLRTSPSAGMLELLAPCSGVSELLAPERQVL